MPLLGLSTPRTEASQSIAEVLRIEKILAGILLKDGIISSEEVEIVEYGLENFGSSLLGMSITLVIGYCFDFLWGSFLLWLLVFPLRKNAGGFHAATKGRCLLFSSAMLLVSIICFVKVRWSMTGYILIAAFFFIVIFYMAPVENCNKHLDPAEHRVYRKRTRAILLLEGVFLAVAIAFEWKEIVTVTTTVFFIVGVSLVMGRAKLWDCSK